MRAWEQDAAGRLSYPKASNCLKIDGIDLERGAIRSTTIGMKDAMVVRKYTSLLRSLWSSHFEKRDGVGDRASPDRLIAVDQPPEIIAISTAEPSLANEASILGQKVRNFAVPVASKQFEPTTLECQPCHLELLPAACPQQARCLSSVPREVVPMTPLEASKDILSSIDLIENCPGQPWHQNAFTSCTSSLYELNDVIVHGAVGIIAISSFVIAETLWHTATDRHRYQWRDAMCDLTFDHAQRLEGRYASILTGAAESYWHAVFDATARLGVIPAEIWDGIDGLLIPSTGVRQRELVDLYGVPDHVAIRSVEADETFAVDTLVLPSSIHDVYDYHPLFVNEFYDRILRTSGVTNASPNRRVYIDRRRSGLRRLQNEDAVVECLNAFGFEAVQIENLSVVEQVALFRTAAVIVAPHGAGLANIGFALPGTIIIELMMDAYLNWCFRRISAIRGLEYHCVIGRSDQPVVRDVVPVHARTWTVDIHAIRDLVASRLSP